jgi:RHH-type rel operon transcriptional repressor/antitoxin RelB
MIKSINLSQDIQKRLLALSQEVGRQEDELIQEAIILYLEDCEDLKDAQERRANLPDRYYSLEEVEQELGLGDSV